MNTQTAIRIMLVDDHALVREGIAAMISARAGFRIVAEAASGEQAIELFRRHQPDVTLMDLRMPGMGGVAAIEALRQEFPMSRFIALTTYEGDEDIYRALRAGVQAYLLKGMSFNELLNAITTVHQGLRHFPPEITKRLEERAIDLSEREREILRLMAQGKKNKEIAAALAIAESTVKWHITTILTKLGVSDRTQAVRTAIERGLVHL